jgi:hypothetical protein
MKQTFEIPEGCKVVTVEQIGNQLITSFEPEKYEPEVGDYVKMTYPSGSSYFCKVSAVAVHRIGAKNVIATPDVVLFEDYSEYFTYDSIEKITPEEFQAEFEKLGYVYDFETHTAHEKRWRAERFGEYYIINSLAEILKVNEHHCQDDEILYNIGNYFKTLEDAKAKVNEIKKLLKQ